MFFVIVLIFCLVSGDVCFASSVPNYSGNIIARNYIITYNASVEFTITSDMFSPGQRRAYHYNDLYVPLKKFADGLFRQSGNTDVVDGLYYVDNFSFQNSDIFLYNADGSLRWRGSSNGFLGTAYFNNKPGDSFAIPWDGKKPVVFHSSTYDNFSQSSINGRYYDCDVLSVDIGRRVVHNFQFVVEISTRFYAQLGDVIDAIHQYDSDVTIAIDRQTEQQKQYHDRDESDANSAKTKIIGLTDDFDELQTKWAILWYPITFTNKILDAFTGQRARDVNDNYIVGYNYNDDTGGLEPIYDFTRSGRSSGASITFPSFTLPVLDLKLWDSYTYDLSQLPEQYSVLFNALYVVVGVLELYWFVGFLSNKYHQIFGG